MDKMFCLKIPDGYEIIKRVKEYNLYDACDILRSKRQKRITKAIRTGDRAQLTSHYIKCPHCGNEMPAYAHYFNNKTHALPKGSVDELALWADLQLSMISEPEAVLDIQVLYDYHGEYICEKCGYGSKKSTGITEVDIYSVGSRLYVKKPIKNLSELICLQWLSGVACVKFPMCEQLVFDFDGGTVFAELISNSEVICNVTITDNEGDFHKDGLIDLLSKNILIKRRIKSFFEEITGYKMPFAPNEIDFDKLVSFVRFTGFPRAFYDAIPFWKGTRVVDESFKDISERLRTPEGAMELLEKSSIPFCKSVKKVFSQKSGLFFYLKECEFIYDAFKDVNLFCSFLKKENVFYFFSMMHYYDESLKAFLRDYALVLGKNRFANRFKPEENLVSYAMFYSSLSAYVRKKEQQKWLDGVDVFDNFYILVNRENNISTPLIWELEGVKSGVLDKYRFEPLKTKRECVATGEKMNNCLVNWDTCSNPVVAVYKGDKIMAAMEFFKNTLIQAKGCKNKSIAPDSDLFKVIEKWCGNNNIGFVAEDVDGPFLR